MNVSVFCIKENFIFLDPRIIINSLVLKSKGSQTTPKKTLCVFSALKMGAFFWPLGRGAHWIF
jgi:hypothetical protein